MSEMPLIGDRSSSSSPSAEYSGDSDVYWVCVQYPHDLVRVVPVTLPRLRSKAVDCHGRSLVHC